MNLENRILINLAILTRDYTPARHVIDHALTNERREAEARRAATAAGWEQENAAGWFATPKLGSDMQRSRAVRKLLSDGLVEEKGRGRGRLIRLTEAGHAAASESMQQVTNLRCLDHGGV